MRWVSASRASASRAHAQFELIHPFDDGNGRIGRLLIPIYLAEQSCILSPSFYISAYFERRREEYNARLQAISAEGDWAGWLRFFLEGVERQAKSNIDLVRRIQALYERMKREVTDSTHSQVSISLIDALFDRPIFRASELHVRLGIKRARASGYINRLAEMDILKTVRSAAGRRSAILAFEPLLRIVDESA